MANSPGISKTFGALFGALAAVALLAACSGASGPVTETPSPIGLWGSEATEEPNLSFTSGEVAGTDGCNRLSGTWEYDPNGRIKFGPIAATQMYCENVNTWLIHLDSAVIEHDNLHIFNAQGIEIGTLERN
ncbi:MAG: META domain-containing protein [Gulosibacter sp.]|uniref:META domain-containing protein n=1 Tax=Gulosibacter sp. TaxID=2817531 RepID=UPI003F8E561A